MTNKLILASTSPRRQELLRQVNLSFSIINPEINEAQITTGDPMEKVQQLAALKAENVSIHAANEVVLAADTVVAHQQHIFEKPKDREEAHHMISSLSGSVHDVYTGVVIRSSEKKTIIVEQTQVKFWPLTDDEIDWYVSTEEPYDKAGAYGIQSLGAMFVKQIVGDYYNVVGLPISRVVRELRTFSIYAE